MDYRAFDDYTAARQNTYNQFLEAAKGIQPFEYGGRRIEVADVEYDKNDLDEDSDRWSFDSQAKAVYEKQTLGRRLKATLRMTDLNTGESTEQKKIMALVPRVNEDGGIIYRGTKYNVVNQQRLKPGIYGRVKKNEELESFLNAKVGTGSMHRYIFNPANQLFYLNTRNSRIPLTSLLQIFGVGEDKIKEAWGDEIARTNLVKKDPKAIDKIYENLVSSKDKVENPTPDEKMEAIKKSVLGIGLDPWITKRNLGIESDHLTPEIILASTKKTLEMLRGNIGGDDRDHLANQTVHAIEDLLAERIRMDSGREQKNNFRIAAQKNSLDVIPSRFLQKQIESTLFGSGLAIQPEYANPLNAWDLSTRITKMGDGGIGSTEAIPMESRDFHASHTGFIDSSRTAESLKVGVDLNLTSQARKGADGKIYTALLNARTGGLEYKSAEDISDLVIAPQNVQDVPGYVAASRNGKEDFFKPEEIDYFLPDAETAFSQVANLIPMKTLQPQNRTAMGSRFITQSVPLIKPEAPLVRSAVPGSNRELSFDTLYRDRAGVISSKVEGVVREITPDKIVVESIDENGRPVLKNHWIHRHTPLGSKTAIINRSIVEVGQHVQPDDVLATSNFSDENGDIALGVNARMALMPWRDNYEDAYTISESFAKRLASHQSYDFRREFNDSALTDVKSYISALPSQFSKEQINKLDDTGVIQVGQQVTHGDPLVLSAVQKSTNLSKPLLRSGHRAFVDQSQTWEHEVDGIVSNVYKDKRGNVVVSVDTESPMVDGDKLSELYGTKGIVHIIPDDQMIQDEQGRPFDIVSSDLGLISRKNSSRALAMLLGKVAEKTGKPYLLDEADPNIDIAELTAEELKRHGISDTETVIDPTSGRKIPGILTGPQFVMKLSHLAESKAHARSVGSYTQDNTPAKGPEEGMQAKKVSNQELGALVAHGSMNYLREIATVKGDRNDEWVARYMSGQDLPAVKVPFVYEKFLSYLKGMGVNPVRTGSVTKLWLMSNDDIQDLTGNREIRSADTVDLVRDLKPIKGGLFDPAIFGDDGTKFAQYKLSTSIPHPLMEKPLIKLMDVTEKSYRDILAGKEDYKDFGTGPEAIAQWLSKLDVDKELASVRSKIPGSARTTKDKLIQRMRHLSSIKKQDLDPSQLMLDRVPIIPPIYRPISKLQGKDTPLIDGMNMLYQQMIYADQNLAQLQEVSESNPTEQIALYDAVQASLGMKPPADKELQQKQVKGLMKRLVGKGPKQSFVQQKLLGSTVDNVGRGVAVPNAELGMNEIGIPEEQAWEIFKLPVMRRLTKRGIPVHVAREMIDERKDAARQAMLQEMEIRPVTASRAPVLHKFGMLGFMPKIVEGHSLQVNPLVHAGYGLDHDGDTMNFHAVITDEAVEEVKQRMLPSKNLRSVSDFQSPMFVPRQDHALGLYLASTAKEERRPVVFENIHSAIRAFKKGDINISTPVKIMSK